MATITEISEIENDDLSSEIAQAVASIVAESKFYKEDDALESSRFISVISAGVQSPQPKPSVNSVMKKKVKGAKSGSIDVIKVQQKQPKKKLGKEKEKNSTWFVTKKDKSNINKSFSKKQILGDKKSDKISADTDHRHFPVLQEHELVIPNFLDPYHDANEPLEVSHASQMVDKPIMPPSLKDSRAMDMSLYLARVQTYLDNLGYEREGEPKTQVNIRLSIKHLMSTARELIKIGQSIKCLHALILAVHFTNHISIIERFPVHFKSVVNEKEYKHVVLGVYVQGHFGALGLSRDPGLQDKPAVFPRLSELINDFYRCYIESGHELTEVKIGAIITHEPHSLEHITWKLGKVSFRAPPDQIEFEIEKCSKKLRSQMGLSCLRCIRWNPVGVDQYSTGGFQRSGLNTSRSKSTVPPKSNPNNTASSGNSSGNARSRPFPFLTKSKKK